MITKESTTEDQAIMVVTRLVLIAILALMTCHAVKVVPEASAAGKEPVKLRTVKLMIPGAD